MVEYLCKALNSVSSTTKERKVEKVMMDFSFLSQGTKYIEYLLRHFWKIIHLNTENNVLVLVEDLINSQLFKENLSFHLILSTLCPAGKGKYNVIK
jgi:hypothetical protein